MHRRDLLKYSAAGAAGVLFAGGTAEPRAAGVDHLYEGLDTKKYLGELKTLAKVDDAKIFTEGPCCDRAGNVFFTNTEVSKILKWDGKALSVFRENSGGANGLLFDKEGRLIAC